MPLRRVVTRRVQRRRQDVRKPSRPYQPLVQPAPATCSTTELLLGRDQPSHSEAFRPVNCLQTYSTGFMKIPGELSPHFLGAFLRLYTHGKVDGNSWEGTIQCLKKVFDSLTEMNLTARNPVHAFGALAKVTSRVLEQVQNSRDAFVQLFSAQDTTAKSWTVSCSIAKSSDGARSRPWISIKSNTMRLVSKSVPARAASRSVFKNDSASRAHLLDDSATLSWEVSGEVKPDPYGAASSSLDKAYAFKYDSAFQLVADGINNAAALATGKPRSWVSFDTLMLSIQRELLAHLPSSLLTTVLDTRQLGIVLTKGHAGGFRYVRQIRLSADGTVRASDDGAESSGLKMLPILESHSAVEPANESFSMLPARKADSATEPDIESTIPWESNVGKPKKFSQEVAAKLGVDIPWTVNLHGSIDMDIDSAFAALNSACETSDAKGFECLAGAVPPTLTMRTGPIEIKGNDDGAPRCYKLRIDREKDTVRVKLYLPPISVPALALDAAGFEPSILVTLTAVRGSEDASSPTQSVASTLLMPCEMSFLTQAAELVADRVSRAAVFDNSLSAARAIAEAMLRFITFRTPSLQLLAVTTRVAVSQTDKAGVAVHWESRSDDEVKVQLNPPDLSTTLSAGTDKLQHTEDQEAEEPMGGDRVATVPFQVIEPDGETSVHRDIISQGNGSAASLEVGPSHTVGFVDSAHSSASRKGTRPSSAQAVGTARRSMEFHLAQQPETVISQVVSNEKWRHTIKWSKGAAPSKDQLSFADLCRIVHREVSLADPFTFNQLLHAEERMKASLPGEPTVNSQLTTKFTGWPRYHNAEHRAQVRMEPVYGFETLRVVVKCVSQHHEDQRKLLSVKVIASHRVTTDFASLPHGDEILAKFWETTMRDVFCPIVEAGNWDNLSLLSAACRRAFEAQRPTGTPAAPIECEPTILLKPVARKDGQHQDGSQKSSASGRTWPMDEHTIHMRVTDAEYHLDTSDIAHVVRSQVRLDQVFKGFDAAVRISWKAHETPDADSFGITTLRELVKQEMSRVEAFTLIDFWNALRCLREVLPSKPQIHGYIVPVPTKHADKVDQCDYSAPRMGFILQHGPSGDQLALLLLDIVRSKSGRRLAIRTEASSPLPPGIMPIADGATKLTSFWSIASKDIIRPIVEGADCSDLDALQTACRRGLEEYVKATEPENSSWVITDVHARWVSGEHGQENFTAVGSTGSQEPAWRRNIFLAMGSNVGDRFKNIEDACDKLDQCQDIRIIETSPLYETEPMYVEDQGRFLNGVCAVETTLSPMDLLDRLQAIENDLGRVKFIDKGPRNIDLDIIAYDQEIVNNERLTLPHLLMTEREFVLRPLCNLDAARNWRHPKTRKPLTNILGDLSRAKTAAIFSATPLAPACEPLRALDPSRRTHIMSILNVTPDSFSDGGVHAPDDVNTLIETIRSHIAAGATIIDIGGQSSRPGAPDVTAEEEISRILPAIAAIKSMPEAAKISISVDTYRASVAEAAINAGAHIINDISAGLLDPKMLSTIARLRCTYIMMHMRGSPATMQSPENTTYPKGIADGIYDELMDRLDAAQQAGIRRWRIILDPGFGFAKTAEQNVQLLHKLSTVRNQGSLKTLPWLIGTSRKGFIGQVTGTKVAADRVGGTAATVTRAVQADADIVRVHDIETMRQVVRMSEAMYRAVPTLPKRQDDGRGLQPTGEEASKEVNSNNAAAALASTKGNTQSAAESDHRVPDLQNHVDEAAHGTESRVGEAGLQATGDESTDNLDHEPDPGGISQTENVDEVAPKQAAAELRSSEDELLNEIDLEVQEVKVAPAEDGAPAEQESEDEGVGDRSTTDESTDELNSEVKDIDLAPTEVETAGEAEPKNADAYSEILDDKPTNDAELEHRAIESNLTEEDGIDSSEPADEGAPLEATEAGADPDTTNDKPIDEAGLEYGAIEFTLNEEDVVESPKSEDEGARFQATNNVAESHAETAELPAVEDDAVDEAETKDEADGPESTRQEIGEMPTREEVVEEPAFKNEESEPQPAQSNSVEQAESNDEGIETQSGEDESADETKPEDEGRK